MAWDQVLVFNLVIQLVMCLFFSVTIVIRGDQIFPVLTTLSQTLLQPNGWPSSSHSSFKVVYKSTQDGTILGFHETNWRSGLYELSIIWTLSNITSINNGMQKYEKVWSANRDRFVQLSSKLELKPDGNLILYDHNDFIIWSTNVVSKTAGSTYVLKSGRMTGVDLNGSILWNSCQHPTDTLLVDCYVDKNAPLIANSATNDPSSGMLMFRTTKDEPLGLYKDSKCGQPYWTANDDNSIDAATIMQSIDKQFVQLYVFVRDRNTISYDKGYGAINIDVGDLFFLRLDHTGVLQWYIFSSSLLFDSTSNGWVQYNFDMSKGCMYKRCSIHASCENLQEVSFSSTLIGKFVIAGGGFFIGLFIYFLVGYIYKRVNMTSISTDMDEDVAYFKSLQGLPPRFSKKELEVATDNFSKVLGRGGFGVVYEGILQDNSKVAVKKIQRERQGQEAFRAEIATIGNLHHRNLVHLCGFCSEGSDQMLVYEYMAHGSLDRWLFGDLLLEWTNRSQIALDTAIGLRYLHNDCRQKIFHFDVKPQNILLNERFHAKLANFGTSKICEKETSQITTSMRGTPGYCAPEWSRLPTITEKCDVYSYGMVLLEIIGGRKNTIPDEVPKKWYFPTFAAKKLEQEKSCKNIVDTKISGGFNATDWDQATKMLKIAFWCIQDDRDYRPTMEVVVHMLEGVVEVEDPPLVFEFFGLVQH